MGIYCNNPYTKRRDWLALIIQCSVLGMITMTTHCAEVVVHLIRDEYLWRRASTVGATFTGGALTQGVVMFPVWLLFCFKSVLHWVFSSAFSTNCLVVVSLIPLCTVAGLLLLLALFSEAFSDRLQEALGDVLDDGKGEDWVGALFLEVVRDFFQTFVRVCFDVSWPPIRSPNWNRHT